MKFIYIDRDGETCGPTDQIQVERAIAEGKLTRESALRNAMLGEFRTVGEFKCFEKALAEAEGRDAAPGVEGGSSGNGFWDVVRQSRIRGAERNSAFVRGYLPRPAPFFTRLLAAFTDLLMLGVVAAALLLLLPREAKYVSLTCYVVIALAFFYYSLSLSVYAQTLGMYYWGIFLARKDLEESYFLRTFFYVLLLMTTFPLLAVFYPVSKRNLAELLTGTRVICVYGATRTL